MTTFVQLCGFGASEVADLRADFGSFADTKHRELPGPERRLETAVSTCCNCERPDTYFKFHASQASPVVGLVPNVL